jgi:hypothetical protein
MKQTTIKNLFVKFVNENAEKIRLLAKLESMTKQEKIQLIKEFMAAR